jgi:hypothetical protein
MAERQYVHDHGDQWKADKDQRDKVGKHHVIVDRSEEFANEIDIIGFYPKRTFKHDRYGNGQWHKQQP